MSHCRSLLLLTGLIICGVASASTTVRVDSVDWSRGQQVYFMENGQVVLGYAGAIVLNANNINTSVLCVDLFTNVNIGDTFAVNLLQPAYLDPSHVATGQRAAYLFLTQYGTITQTLASLNPGITLAQATAGLQLAIWDIVHDGGDGFAAGAIRSSAASGQATDTAVLNAALHYVQVSLNYQNGPGNATIWRHVDGPTVKQQLLGFEQPGTGPGIPEPATSLLIGGGLGLLGWRQYRRRKE